MDVSHQQSLSSNDEPTDELQRRLKNESHQGRIGLVNIGNSCYMNSSLQALSNCLPFRKYFTECLPPQSSCNNVSSALSLLFKKMWTSERNPGNLSPRPVSSSMKQKMFRGWQQQDAQEFLRCLFNQIHDELGISLPKYYHSYSKKSLEPNEKQPSFDQESVCSSNGSSTELIAKPRSHSASLYEQTQTVTKPKKPLSLPSSPSVKPKLSTMYSQLSETLNKGKLALQENSDEFEDTHTVVEQVIVVKDAVIIVNTTSGLASVEYPSNEELFNSRPVQENQRTTDQVISIITEIFQGLLESRVKCLQCSKVSITQEPFQDLSLPIPGRKDLARLRKQDLPDDDDSHTFGSRMCRMWNVVIGYTRDIITGPPTSLEDCLEAFFDSSDLSGENRYLCQHCKSFQNSKKEMLIVHLPEVICIHLKRFRYDAFFTSKISRHIQFPLNDLDMSPYMKYRDEEPCLYELFSVITHIGGAGGGHYISYAKGSDGMHWYEFNDARVSSVSSDDVLRTEGYLLFYQKRSSCPVDPINLADIVPYPGTSIPSQDVCYVSRHWLTLRNSCLNPGPVIPYEFACEHGGILPGREQYAKSLGIPIRKEVFDQLVKRYGGGPLVSLLETCEECKSNLIKLTERRNEEKEKVTEIQAASKGLPETVLLSRFWLKQWQDFINSSSLEVQPPGPIDNSSLILSPSSDNVLKMNTKHPYRSITVPIWKYLHFIYGGGPLVATSRENLTI